MGTYELELDPYDADLLAEAEDLLVQAEAGATGEDLVAIIDQAAHLLDRTDPLGAEVTDEVAGLITDTIAALVAGAVTADDLRELAYVPIFDRATVHRILEHRAYDDDELLFDLAEVVRDRFGHLLPFLDRPGAPRRLALLSPTVGVELRRAAPVLRRWQQLPPALQQVADELVGTWEGPLGGFLDVVETTAA